MFVDKIVRFYALSAINVTRQANLLFRPPSIAPWIACLKFTSVTTDSFLSYVLIINKKKLFQMQNELYALTAYFF